MDSNNTLPISIGQDVATVHPEYAYYYDQWDEMRDHLQGQRRIKQEGTKYLPMLGDENDEDDRRQYKGYLERALYYEATKRTHEALTGAVLSKPPVLSGFDAEKYEEAFEQVTMDGYSFNTFVRNVISELVAVSRVGVLVERSQDGESVYFVQYNTEDIVNWRFQRVADQVKLTMVVLQERHVVEKGRFSSEEQIRYRVLELTDGIYTQSVFNELRNDKGELAGYTQTEEVVPVNVGEPLSYIPFVFFSPLGNVPHVSPPVLSSVAAINTSHYRTSADLEHGRHFTGLPTAWVAGFDTDTRLQIGSQIAWVSDNPQARAGFLEFTGAGLTTLERALMEKQEQMATMGARMLRPPRAGVEAAETARIYQSAETGALANLATAAAESFTALLRTWLRWQGDEEPAAVSLNTDYVDSRLSGQDLTALLSAWQTGAISYDTLFYNMKQGEIVPDAVTVEDERDRIAQDGPSTEPE